MSDLLSAHLLRLAKMAEESGKHQDAYEYYVRVLDEHPDDAEATLGKGIEAGWLSTYSHFRLPEMLNDVGRALQLAAEPDRPGLGARAAAAIDQAAKAYFKTACKSLADFGRLEDNWGEYVNQSMGILDALKYAHELAPSNQQIVKDFIKVCFANIQGIPYEDKFDRDDNGFPRSKINRLPREHEKLFKEQMKLFVAKRREVDPKYRPPRVKRPATTRLAGVLVGLAVLGSAAWITYCAWPSKPQDGRLLYPGVTSFARSYVIAGLDKSYGVSTCRILYVDPVPEGRYQVTGEVRPQGRKPVLFQLRVRYHPESASPAGKYAAETLPRFESPLLFSN